MFRKKETTQPVKIHSMALFIQKMLWHVSLVNDLYPLPSEIKLEKNQNNKISLSDVSISDYVKNLESLIETEQAKLNKQDDFIDLSLFNSAKAHFDLAMLQTVTRYPLMKNDLVSEEKLSEEDKLVQKEKTRLGFFMKHCIDCVTLLNQAKNLLGSSKAHKEHMINMSYHFLHTINSQWLSKNNPENFSAPLPLSIEYRKRLSDISAEIRRLYGKSEATKNTQPSSLNQFMHKPGKLTWLGGLIAAGSEAYLTGGVSLLYTGLGLFGGYMLEGSCSKNNNNSQEKTSQNRESQKKRC